MTDAHHSTAGRAFAGGLRQRGAVWRRRRAAGAIERTAVPAHFAGAPVSENNAHLRVAKVADLQQRPRVGVQQRILQLDVPVRHTLRPRTSTE